MTDVILVAYFDVSNVAVQGLPVVVRRPKGNNCNTVMGLHVIILLSSSDSDFCSKSCQ